MTNDYGENPDPASERWERYLAETFYSGLLRSGLDRRIPVSVAEAPKVKSQRKITRQILSRVISRYSGLTDVQAQIAFLTNLGFKSVNVRGRRCEIPFKQALTYSFSFVDKDGQRITKTGRDFISGMYQRTMEELGECYRHPETESSVLRRVLELEEGH